MEAAAESEAAREESQEGKIEEGDEEDAAVARTQRLISKIVDARENPNPRHIHALATVLELHESRYTQESGSSSLNNGRSSHLIGRLGNLIQDHDDLYDLISSKFLTDSRYSLSVRAATTRLLLCCSSAWVYPPVLDDDVLENIKSWVMEDISCSSGDQPDWKSELGPNKPTDSEMLKAYSTGLLAISLSNGGHLVEDVLNSRLSAKLMRYLRTRVMGEVNAGQKDPAFTLENKQASGASSIRCREDNRRRVRPVADVTRSEPLRIGDELSSVDQSTAKDPDREEFWSESAENSRREDSDPLDINRESEPLDDKCRNRDVLDGRSKVSERNCPNRSSLDDDGDDSDPRRRMNRGMARSRSRGRGNDGNLEGEQLSSPGGEPRATRNQGRNFNRNEDPNIPAVEIKNLNSTHQAVSDCLVNGDMNDERFRDCCVGERDISDLVKKAVEAAEAEARVAEAPPEAVKAAGDAAAELVKTSALEIWNSTKDEEAAVLAASRAASTVVEAAISIAISVKSQVNSGHSCESSEPVKEDYEEFSILDEEELSQLRERYCIQCLEILGEYVEALGPVLHEKGVDVCLALLQRCFVNKDSSQALILLPEVLKLICSLAAHRKFAAVFVDRGGIQKLLSVQRISQTFLGLSSCLFTIGTLQGIMERVCALPSEIVTEVVELALQLLSCSQDQARKNAAIFFAAAFVFRAILDSFDAREGLQKMLNLLHGFSSIRLGGGTSSGAPNLANSATTLRNDRFPADVLTSLEKQIAYQTCVSLRQYYRAHLLLLVDYLRPNKSGRSLPRHSTTARAAYKPLDISNEAMESVFLLIQRDRKLGAAIVRTRWPPVEHFISYNGHVTLLELCHAPPAERYLHDLAQYALGVLHVVTLFPYARKMVVSAALSNDRTGMAVILDALNSAGGVDPEVIQQALNVLVNLVCPPPSISNKPPQTELKEQYLGDSASSLSTPSSNIASGVVGDRRISLGTGSGCAGLAAQLEQGYRQARESVRANNGIKVLLNLLHPRIITPPATLDCLRALTCRVLLGLARDETIAHILTQLQVGKKLSELIRDNGGGQSYGSGEQGRWQTELSQVAIELMSIVTNSGRACTLAATDAAAPTLRRIERAAIAAATPITYHSRELLLLIHEHLLASGLTTTAASLQKEAHLSPLPYPALLPQYLHQAPAPPPATSVLHWPTNRSPLGFLSLPSPHLDPETPSSKKRHLQFSPSFSLYKSIPSLPLKRKQPDTKDSFFTPPPKRAVTTQETSVGQPLTESTLPERVTLDSLVVQYLKHQHRQCPVPITTLPPLSLLTPHVCPEPSRNLHAPINVAARISTREFSHAYEGGHGNRRDRQFIYSRFRPLRSCRDDGALLTCAAFLGGSSRIASGTHTGEIKVFNTEDGGILDSQQCHQSPVTMIESLERGNGSALLLTSGHYDVRMWEAAALAEPVHVFEGCKAARFSHSGEVFAGLAAEAGSRDVMVYDVETCGLSLRLVDGGGSGPGPGGRGYTVPGIVHFSPLDTMVLWNGVLWDRRVAGPIHRFDQFTDYGGGGFHPSGNEVIINSEVWDLRKFRLLQSVMSLDQTIISFNSTGDVIYAILRRNLEDLSSAIQTRRVRHPLFPAFRTIDAVSYSDIATYPVDRCVLDLAPDPTDSVLAVVAMDDHDDMFSSTKLYEIGRRRPTDDDSDPDDLAESDESDEDVDSDVGSILDEDEIGIHLDDDDEDDDEDDEGFVDVEDDGDGHGILEIVTEEEDDDDDDDDEDSDVLEVMSSGEETDFLGRGDYGF